MKKHNLRKELDKVKGIAKRLYDASDIGTMFFQRKSRGSPIGAGIYFPTPEPMLDVGINYMKKVKAEEGRLMPPGSYWTPQSRGREKNTFLDLIADKLRKENKIDVNSETDILLTSGIAQGMLLVPMMLIDPGDEVLVTDPDYMRLRSSKLFGGKIVNVPLKERKGVIDETRWYFDPEELESRITDKSKLFSFCNPNNPTGYVYSKDDLNAIARIAKQHDLFVLTNECYERFVWTDKFFDTLIFDSIAAVQGMKERTFTLQGITKAYETEGNMTVGWCNGPSEYISILKWLQFTSCQKWGTALGGYMGMAVLTPPFREEYIRQQWKIYTAERDRLWKTLNQFSWIECGKAKGGPFMFPDVSGCGMSDAKLAEFLRDRGVGVGSGTAWAEDPKCGAGHLRLSYCSPRELQKKMVRELEETLIEYEVLHKDLIIN